MSPNRVSNSIMHVTLNTINNVLLTTLNIVFSITNTTCKANIICHSLKNKMGFIDLQYCNY